MLDATPFQIQGKPTLEIYQVKKAGLPAGAVLAIDAFNNFTWTFSGTNPAHWLIYSVSLGGVYSVPIAGSARSYNNNFGLTGLYYIYGVNTGGTKILADSNSVTANPSAVISIDSDGNLTWAFGGTNPAYWTIYDQDATGIETILVGTSRGPYPVMWHSDDYYVYASDAIGTPLGPNSNITFGP